MPELKKIEFSAAFTPSEGSIVEYFSEEAGEIVLKVKKSDGSETVLSGGYDTSDATATAADVSAGLVFYGAGGRDTGTLSDSEGYLDGGVVTIPAGRIRQTQTIQVPQGMDFYRCASVDTSAKTWTGYKALLADGLYSFEETVTAGLTYTDIVPEVGGIYANGTNVCVAYLNTGFPEGYVFFDALSSSDGWTMNGATVVADDNRDVFQTVNDWDGPKNAVISTDPGVPLKNNPFSLSFWFKRTSTNDSCWCGIGYGTSGTNNRVAWGLINDYPGVTYWAHDHFQTEVGLVTDTDWHHFVVTYDGAVTKNYMDGTLLWEWQTGTVDIDWEYINVGDPWEGYQSNGRYADYYIYPRVLQAYEVNQLLEARTV